MSVNHSARSGGIIEISVQFSIGDSKENTQYTIFNIRKEKKKKITVYYPKSPSLGFFFQGSQDSHGKRARRRRRTK